MNRVSELDSDVAVVVLMQNIGVLRTVSEWAHVLGYDSVRLFSNRFKKLVGVGPKRVMVELRMTAIRRYIRLHPDDINYAVARACGLEDEQALYKFLKYNYDTSPTDLRKELV